MTIEENKALVRRFIDDVFVNGSVKAVDELLTDDFVAHNWPSTGAGNGKADLKAAIERVSKGLADPKFVIDDLVAEGDRVVARVTSSARQVGPFMGMPGTGKSYSIAEIHIFRIADGKIAEHWHQLDAMGMMQQLGLNGAG
jgi:steroid delta-isomerase-like uncharacterized protein